MSNDFVLQRSNGQSKDFAGLVRELDAYLTLVDREDHAFYDQYNQIDDIEFALVAYLNNEPVGCGAIKPLGEDAMEVKRMFVLPEQRGKGIASAILNGLEEWARNLGMKKCILETGKRQKEAVAFYSRNGYIEIPNFGQYKGVENSVCFEKGLIPSS